MRNSRLMVQGAAVLALGVLAAGCASIKDHRGYIIDEALVATVQPGVDNKLSVERTLGRPTFISQYGKQTWYYVAMNTGQKPFTRPKTASQSVLIIDFDARGNVASMSREGMAKVARLSPESDKTDTLGRDRSFFQDLFGNIGAVGAGGAGPGAPPGGSGPNGS
ncbi:MAG: cell envelope protein SmpA [Novosphingobium sp. 32-60-15]|uniref:outer membrane protein assembly factor BamE n=1 Tax=unclassified Novosphingobium TaxID=2644732 RepID=UPI000BD605BB|nr:MULTISPECIES: outer membrane protein assembly factor BamE [unclassified Novosphingobium]OYX61766.1 MAG: cell envelope protein SmpA [Novosphingobium sp. 32-60-15]